MADNESDLVEMADSVAATTMAAFRADPTIMADGIRTHPEFGGEAAAEAMLRILRDTPSSQAVESMIAYSLFLCARGDFDG